MTSFSVFYEQADQESNVIKVARETVKRVIKHLLHH